jgi:mersacidin/lichenicidin family type 2 lantibiotic
MSLLNIIRAWKDEEYCSSLSETERMLLPQNPAGLVVVSDDDLGGVNGAAFGSCHSCSTCITVDCDLTASTVSPL